MKNESYKNQYHFTDKYSVNKKNLPSLNGPKDINSTIKENPKGGTVEIEGKEIVLNPDLMGIFLAQGKRHSNGGMDSILRDNAFVFSDFNKLKLSEKEKDLFELGGTKKATTPAKTLLQNVDLKHYNTLVNNLQDGSSDLITKRSSGMMLEKYINTIGKIAYLQEAKKDFPTGVPAFAQGTAPVIDDSLKENLDTSKQYAKQGGLIKAQIGRFIPNRSAPFNPNFSTRGRTANPYRKRNLFPTVNPVLDIPTPEIPNSNLDYGPYSRAQQSRLPWGSEERYSSWTDKLRHFGFEGTSNTKDVLQAQQFMSTNFPGVVHDSYASGSLRVNNLGIKKGFNPRGSKNTLEQNNIQFVDGLWGVDNPQPEYINFENAKELEEWKKNMREVETGNKTPGLGFAYVSPTAKMSDKDFLTYYIPRVNTPRQLRTVGAAPEKKLAAAPEKKLAAAPEKKLAAAPEKKLAAAPEKKLAAAQDKEVDWQFTPWQQMSQAYNWGKYAKAKRYMPFRSQYEATYMDPALVNPEQTIADTQGAANQSLAALSYLSPILRNAQANSTTGQLMNTIPGIRSQYDNQNAQIINQARQFNTQIRNQESLTNMANDQQYYEQVVKAKQNFDNLRTSLADNAMNNVMRDVETNQTLAYEMAAQRDPAWTYDFRTGNFKRLPKSILDVEGSRSGDYLEDYLKRVRGSGLDKYKMLELEGKVLTGKHLGELAKAQKGGKITKRINSKNK